MAYTAGNIGDQTGIGQGLAFVLPEGKTAAYAMQLAQTHAGQLQDMARQKLQLQVKAQEAYQKDFKNQELPKAFAPFDKELNDRQNKWLQDGAKIYATTGKNPYNDPDFIARHNTDILTPASKSLELGQNYTKLRAIAETDPANKYTKDSKQAIIDYQKQIEQKPFEALDKPLPQLVETPASADDLAKTLKATSIKTDDGRWETKGPDSSSHKAQAFAALLGDPKWHPLLQKYGYNPDLPDFGVYSDPKSPNGKRVWYTNPDFTGHMAQQILESPDDPKSKQILQALGIDPKVDSFASEKLQHAIADQNAAMGKAVTDISARKDAEVPTEKQRKLGEERLDLAERNYDLATQRLQFTKDKQDAKTYYAKNLSDRILSEEPGSGEELSAFYANHPNYGQPLVIKQLNDKNGNPLLGKREIVVPEKTKPNPNFTTVLPVSKINPPTVVSQKSYKVDIDYNKPYEAKAKLASVMKNVGIAVNSDKYMAPSPHQNKDLSPAKPYKASNGKTYSHDDLLKAGYTEEQIKKAISLGNLKQ